MLGDTLLLAVFVPLDVTLVESVFLPFLVDLSLLRDLIFGHLVTSAMIIDPQALLSKSQDLAIFCELGLLFFGQSYAAP